MDTTIVPSPAGKRGRNTEVLTFERDKVKRVEVYFGWDL
jgi:hypothetical protein